MRRNESNTDRILRGAAAAVAVVVAAGAGFSSTAGGVLFVVAGVLAVTAAVSFCSMYRLLGISTRSRCDSNARVEAT